MDTDEMTMREDKVLEKVKRRETAGRRGPFVLLYGEHC